MVGLLLENGIDVSTRESTGQTELHCTVSHGREKITDLLLEGGPDIAVIDGRRQTALHVVAYSGNRAAASLLIEKGVDITATDGNMQTALYLAACSELGYWLLENGTSTDARDDTRRSVPHDTVFKFRGPGMRMV